MTWESLMTIHMSARLAWHMDGWNGHVCKNPAGNTYCVGRFSYPGEMIAEKRDLKFELANVGTCCSKLKDHIPSCIYSINAFGKKQIMAFADPPVFFKDNTSRKVWDLSPATLEQIAENPYILSEEFIGDGPDDHITF
jgi:exodeoxyribonuclease V alpha subunit